MYGKTIISKGSKAVMNSFLFVCVCVIEAVSWDWEPPTELKGVILAAEVFKLEVPSHEIGTIHTQHTQQLNEMSGGHLR